MSYSEFCGQFGLTAEDPATEEVCYDVQNNVTKQFSELYKR